MTTSLLTINFEAINDPQSEFMESDSPGSLFSGAFGAGKTIALCSKALKLSLDYPGNFGLICRKTRTSITHTTLKTFWDEVVPRRVRERIVASYNKTEGLVTLNNGSGIVFGGLDDPLKLGSLNLGWAGIDEALESTDDDFKMLEGRLRKPDMPHQIFAATNPGRPSHYLHEKFFSGNPNYRVFQAATADNPLLPADYLERMESLTGTYYDRNVLGLWVGFEGLVYSSFDEVSCIIPRFNIPNSWLVYTGHDFGLANPAALFYAQDPATGLFYLWHEYLPGAGRSIKEHVEEFKRITEGRNVVRRAGGSHQEDEIRQGYSAQGWPISEPLRAASVESGIQRVYDHHALNKIYVFSDMLEYLREKLSYAYKREDGISTDIIEHKNRFHLMDAERSIISDFEPVAADGGLVREVYSPTGRPSTAERDFYRVR